jgi:uncharacterized protein YkwD
MVDSINRHRAKHGVPPVVLDQRLVDYAKARAEHVADKGALVHDGTGGYGENLYSSSADSTWHDTYIAVNFSSAGNMSGAYKDNVLPPAQ